MAKRRKRVVRYRRPIHINAGFIVFFIIFVYILIISVDYLGKDKISFYEVTKKSISDDNTYRGIVIRDETVYYAESDGYINYYIGDGERAKKSETIYTIDESGSVYKLLSNAEDAAALSEKDLEKVRNSIAAFHKSYTDSHYDTVMDFKYEIENTILEENTETLIANLKNMSDITDNHSFQIVKTEESGIITYTMDGKEEWKESDVTMDAFHETDESRVQLRTEKSLEKGSPVYKMINSEDWKIIIPLTSAQYTKLKELEKVTVTFKKDNTSAVAGVATYQKNGDYFAALSLNQYMIRYANERYLDLELQVNSASGLKIPASSILTKDFLLVPSEYVTVGGSSNTNGVTKETIDEKEETQFTFIPVTVYSSTEDGYSYIESDVKGDLSAGDSIINTQTNESYQLGKSAGLEGVYNVNKGYAVFRVIEKLYENKEYVIVSDGTSYGLSAYDHIVTDYRTIEESAIIK